MAFQWLTFANVQLEKGGATLAQNGETLHLRVLSPSDAHLALEDVSAAPNVWDAANPGLRRITIRVGTAANSAGRLVVSASPGEIEEEPLFSLPLAQW